MQHTLTLTRGPVRLRPLTLDDAEALHRTLSPEMWAGMADPFPETPAALNELHAPMLASETVLAFTVEFEGNVVGRTVFYDLVPGLRVEVGSTFLDPRVWGTTVNPTMKYLMFAHAFDELGLQRVALRCDSRNTRSHRAIAKLGAHFEGTLRNFRGSADGSIVDVDYFSIVAEEWPAVREGLLARLGV
ncbi:GNAT family N-acetyltransferase [Citricoccus sp. NR2]|uniref:GNAT family N-acetyltransferase n=1 Tax=Citricoccus sp. NR2 TaxID=3004095 RepID=UPI0022DD7FB6|nr:GNAT family protein [Citricoccus sp. NR2]WBL20257.1 GNAT family protein [Citricoccus sp. NR2]